MIRAFEKVPDVHEWFTHEHITSEFPWQERAYFSCHSSNGDLLEFGVGRHPSTGTFDAWACFGQETLQTAVSAAGPWPANGIKEAGPFSFEIVEPHRGWRARLAGEASLSFDLTFSHRTAPWTPGTNRVADREGKTVANTNVYFQGGKVNGTVKVGQQAINVDNWLGIRDRAWGFRRSEGRLESGLMIWAALDLTDQTLMLWRVERRTGERVLAHGARMHTDGRVTAIRNWDHILDVSAESATFAGGTLLMRDDDGLHRLDLAPQGRTIFLTSVGYDHKKRHGTERLTDVTVERHVEHTVDLATRSKLTGLDDHSVKVSGSSSGAGVLELQIGRHGRYAPNAPQHNSPSSSSRSSDQP